jgi:hypothetical protein
MHTSAMNYWCPKDWHRVKILSKIVVHIYVHGHTEPRYDKVMHTMGQSFRQEALIPFVVFLEPEHAHTIRHSQPCI